jgi:hypothetical protein
VNSPPCTSGRRRQQGSAAAMEKRGIAPKSPECREAGGTLEKKREDWEWEPSGHETQCLNSPPWLVGRVRERVFYVWGPDASGCKWGEACTCAHVCSHGCAVECDSSRLLTSHWEEIFHFFMYGFCRKMDACFVANTMFCSLVKSNKLLSKTKKKRNQRSPPDPLPQRLKPTGTPAVENISLFG